MSDVEPDSEVSDSEPTSSKMSQRTHRRAKKRNKSQQEDEDTRVHGVQPSSKPVPVGTQKQVKTPWSREEKQAIYSSLHDYIKRGIVPGKEACIKAIEHSGGLLSQRTWRHVKFAVKNLLTLAKRMLQNQAVVECV